MLDHSLSQRQQADDLAHAPAAAPATATIIPDRPTAGNGDGEPDSPPQPSQPEVNPGPPPENNPDLQPDIPPVDNPSISRA